MCPAGDGRLDGTPLSLLLNAYSSSLLPHTFHSSLPLYHSHSPSHPNLHLHLHLPLHLPYPFPHLHASLHPLGEPAFLLSAVLNLVRNRPSSSFVSLLDTTPSTRNMRSANRGPRPILSITSFALSTVIALHSLFWHSVSPARSSHRPAASLRSSV